MPYSYNYMLCLLSLSSVIFCAERPEIPKARIVPYYSLENLSQIRTNQSQHAACSILFDPSGDEHPSTPLTALTRDFSNSIEAGFFPIIVSTSLVYNLLNHSNNAFITSSTRLKNADQWEIYDIQDTNLLLCISRNYRAFYERAGIRFSHFLKKIDANTITKDFNDDKKKNSLGLKAFPIIFQKKDTITWDFIVAGHGLHLEYIAGIKISEIQELLAIFDKDLNTGTVYIASCEAGGQNLALLLQHEKIPISHRFILIVGSVSDSPIRMQFTKEFLENFFSAAALVQDKGAALSYLVKILNEPAKKDIMALPQIWLPGGIDFQSLQVTNFVEVISNVNLQKHLQEKTPILIANKAAVLVYPSQITVPIIIRPINEKIGTISNRATKVPENLEEWCFNNKGKRQIDVITYFHSMQVLFPLVAKMITNEKMLRFCNAFTQGTLLDRLPKAETMYPAFISMKHEIKEQPTVHPFSHKFSKITLELPGYEINPAGVLNFIRDAFLLPGSELKTLRSFVIDELTGPNDIIIMMELLFISKLAERLASYLEGDKELEQIARKIMIHGSPINEPEDKIRKLEIIIDLMYKDLEKQPEYRLYKEATREQIITLKNVDIDIKHDFMRVNFQLNGAGWICILKLKESEKNEWKFRYAHLSTLQQLIPPVEKPDVPEDSQKQLGTVLQEYKDLPEQFKSLRGSLSLLHKGGVQTQHSLKQLQPSFNLLDKLLKDLKTKK